jgi:spermidine/putrescine transport system substrate-binding protein
VSRRALLGTIGAGAGALSLSSWLTACGSGDGSSPSVGTGSLTTTRRQGELRFANWPLYIDRLKGRRPTIDDFERATRIDVAYKEVIADNVSFWAEIRKPLAEGEPIGWDLIVLTDWLISKMIRLGYLEKLDHSRLTNFEEHAGAIYKDPIYDPGNSHSIPWQSGVTGIGYNPKLTGRKITSVNDLFSPEFRGRVGMLAEMYDTMNLTLLRPPRKSSCGNETMASCIATTATATPMPLPTANCPSRWRGPATSFSCSSTIPSWSSSCRTRAPSCGPTTWPSPRVQLIPSTPWSS